MTGTLSGLLNLSRVRHSDRPAVEDPLRGETMTYGELGARADSICDSLIRHGVRPGDRVGICAPKSCGVVATIHGILAAGAAYVPVDASSPYPRIAGIFSDCEVALIVAHAKVVDPLRTAMADAVPLLEDLGDDLQLLRGIERTPSDSASIAAAPEARSERVAYILYTSGSTGKPKGVVHTHASALSFVRWCSDAFAPTHLDRFSSHAPFHFDLSILDIFVPLEHGAAVVIIGEEAGKQPQSLAALIAERRISVWYSTPSILRLLADHGRLERYDVTSLRLVLFAGEVFPVRHLRTLKALWPRPRFFNLYGPTETNVCTFHEVPAEIPAESNAPLPIGRACPNDRTRVVDESGGDVAKGVEGELVVSGGTVMQGYWNLPERTRCAFLRDEAGALWYRTGDIVSETEGDGYLFRGRRDRMVKRRGYRVELGEIEVALATHPSIAEAAVTAVIDDDAGVRIDAFLAAGDAERPSIIELKQFCARNLPGYMVPDRFVVSETIPRTSTGKVDYARLAGGR